MVHEVWPRSEAADAYWAPLAWCTRACQVQTRRCLYGSAPRYLAACCVPVSTAASRQHLRLPLPAISWWYRLTGLQHMVVGPFRSRSDVLELTAQKLAWLVIYCCCFWTITKNISFLRGLVHTVHQRHLRWCAIAIVDLLTYFLLAHLGCLK